MKIRIAFAGLLLVVAAACGTSPTAPAADHTSSAEAVDLRLEEKPSTQSLEGGGTLGSGS